MKTAAWMVLCALLAVAWWYAPRPGRYQVMNLQGITGMVCMDTATGRTWVLMQNDWVFVGSLPKPVAKHSNSPSKRQR